MWIPPVVVCLFLGLACLVWGYDAVDAWLHHNPAAASLYVALSIVLWYIVELEERIEKLEAELRRNKPI